MSTHYIDLNDVQGNIVKGYGRYGYPKARYMFFEFVSPDAGRLFVRSLAPLITTGHPWEDGTERPTATTNIAFSYQGLKHLGLPNETMHTFPDEFCMGMKARAEILGDDGPSAHSNWDPIWQNDKDIHMFLSINAKNLDALEGRYNEIQNLLNNRRGGVKQLFGHKGNGNDNLGYQDASAIYIDGIPTPKEHFGFTDGISDPYFKGCGSHASNVIGGGKRTRQDPATLEGWQPLETGEFLLGYRDEAKELPVAPSPRLLSMNGTFMVYRKLHQNVGSFNQYLKNIAQDYPDGEEALKAKLVGRWSNGAPLSLFADQASADEFIAKMQQAQLQLRNATTEDEKATASAHYGTLRKQLTGFDFHDDIDGQRCPMGSHIRRANPRGCLEYGVKDAYDTPGALVDRRRILRRGLPYGEVTDPNSDDGDHGIVFMALNASIFRQFEFVQQQWINYGNDFKLSNEKDPLIGNQNGSEHMIIQGQSADKPPFFCANIPRFVTTRGGEYFFIPSLTAIRMIADGSVDPT